MNGYGTIKGMKLGVYIKRLDAYVLKITFEKIDTLAGIIQLKKKSGKWYIEYWDHDGNKEPELKQ